LRHIAGQSISGSGTELRCRSPVSDRRKKRRLAASGAFFAVSAQIMRHIPLDRARRRVAAKRVVKSPRVDLDEIPDVSSGRAAELIALDDTLNALPQIDPGKARVIELRFFADQQPFRPTTGSWTRDLSTAIVPLNPASLLRPGRIGSSKANWVI
jgi:hypothetical protein